MALGLSPAWRPDMNHVRLCKVLDVVVACFVGFILVVCTASASASISGSRQCCLLPGLCKQASAQLTLRVTQDGIHLNK